MAEEINETLLEEQSEPSEQDHEVDESVRIIREVSASTEAENTNFTPEVRDKGDSFFRYTVSYGLVAVGISWLHWRPLPRDFPTFSSAVFCLRCSDCS